MGRLKEFGYKDMLSTLVHRNMSQTVIAKGCKLYKFCLIVSTTAHLSIKFKPAYRCGSYATTTGKGWFT